MKALYYTAIFFLLQSCITHYDPLKYYVQGYTPNNDSFCTNGFYYMRLDSTVHTEWPNAITEIYFFKDGSFHIGSNTEHIDSLDKWICQFGEKNFYYSPFGFYTIRNDTIFIEYIVTDPPGFTKAIRYEWKAIPTEQGIRVYELNGKPYCELWTFHANACVPPTVKNWLRRHRKYRLKNEKS